jgi:hypothetical protein
MISLHGQSRLTNFETYFRFKRPVSDTSVCVSWPDQIFSQCCNKLSLMWNGLYISTSIISYEERRARPRVTCHEAHEGTRHLKTITGYDGVLIAAWNGNYLNYSIRLWILHSSWDETPVNHLGTRLKLLITLFFGEYFKLLCTRNPLP